MSDPESGIADEDKPSSEAVREQLQRVLSSGHFVATDRLRRFLRFVVEETLAGRADRLKGYTIGPAVIVLPFENLSGVQDDDVFADGLTEELISNLMRFGQLRLYSAYGRAEFCARRAVWPRRVARPPAPDVLRRPRPRPRDQALLVTGSVGPKFSMIAAAMVAVPVGNGR